MHLRNFSDAMLWVRFGAVWQNRTVTFVLLLTEGLSSDVSQTDGVKMPMQYLLMYLSVYYHFEKAHADSVS